MATKKDETITIQEHLKVNGLVAHAFSPDGKYIAVSLKQDPTVEIYEINGFDSISKWKLIWKLKEQSQQISALSWSVENRLLTGSFDRSILVWDFQNNKWKKDLVIIENERAIITGEWSKNGKKFAIGGGDARAFIGYYDKVNEFWQTYKLQSCKSSVISVAFHPSGKVVGVGSTDNTFNLITCYSPEADANNDYKGTFSNIETKDECIFSISEGFGWVEALVFAPKGNQVVIAAHGGYVITININGEEVQKEQASGVNKLPYKQLKYINENTLICGGYDQKPAIYTLKDGKFQFNKFLENSITGSQNTQDSKIKQLQSQMFNTSHGKKTGGIHTTPILNLQQYPTKDNLFSTTDINGTILFWEV